MRLAIKFAYDGTKFFGLQRQPELRTIEGDIIDCLISHQVIKNPKLASFQVASRTDARVSAIGNVFAINTEFKIKDILNILNSNLKDCWFYGFKEVEPEFNPRFAKCRWYRYHLLRDKINFTKKSNDINDTRQENLNNIEFEILKTALSKFKGTHDFSNFVNPHVENAVRTIDEVAISQTKDWIFIDIKARSFLWHQVRRMISAGIKLVTGDIDEELLNFAINNPDKSHDFDLASPEPLCLMEVKYDFKFKTDKQILKRTRKQLLGRWNEIKIKEIFIDNLLNEL